MFCIYYFCFDILTEELSCTNEIIAKLPIPTKINSMESNLMQLTAVEFRSMRLFALQPRQTIKILLFWKKKIIARWLSSLIKVVMFWNIRHDDAFGCSRLIRW